MPIDAATGNKRDLLANRGHDLYETPAVGTEALLRVERLPEVLWEPACGPGAMVRVLRAAGHVVYATDLIDYNTPDQDEGKWDFLKQFQCPLGVQAIITNPPFKDAAKFVLKGLELCPKVFLLLRLGFYESVRRSAILDGGKLARIHVFSKRLPMMHRAGWEGRKANSGMAFAWFVWDESHTGPTSIDRVLWEESVEVAPPMEAKIFDWLGPEERKRRLAKTKELPPGGLPLFAAAESAISDDVGERAA